MLHVLDLPLFNRDIRLVSIQWPWNPD